MNVDFSKYVRAQILPLACALYVLGCILKKTPFIPDWLIPWILLGLGCLGALCLEGLHIDSVLQGVLACGIAVLSNQLYLQTVRKQGSDKTHQ